MKKIKFQRQVNILFNIAAVWVESLVVIYSSIWLHSFNRPTTTNSSSLILVWFGQSKEDVVPTKQKYIKQRRVKKTIVGRP